MKHLFASLLLCFCLTTQSIAANHYNNDWRSMPFIEMMVAMMKTMNNIMGGGNSFSGFNSLPYSPALMPGMGGIPGMGGLSGFNNLPMSPADFNALPLNSTMNSFQNGFKTGQNLSSIGKPGSHSNNNFWDPDATHFDSVEPIATDSLNGIWQSMSGDVIAIFNNNRFLWSDGRARNLAGQLVIKGNIMMAYIPAKKMTLYFQFYKEPGQFIVRDPNSRIYTFKRIH